jgi:hypothetical protein
MSHYETSTTTGLPNFVTSATWRMKNVRINNRYEMMDALCTIMKAKTNHLTGRIFCTCEWSWKETETHLCMNVVQCKLYHRNTTCEDGNTDPSLPLVGWPLVFYQFHIHNLTLTKHFSWLHSEPITHCTHFVSCTIETHLWYNANTFTPKEEAVLQTVGIFYLFSIIQHPKDSAMHLSNLQYTLHWCKSTRNKVFLTHKDV